VRGKVGGGDDMKSNVVATLDGQRLMTKEKKEEKTA
jgi:hypothetical protein